MEDAARTITIDLQEAACVLALGPYHEGYSYSLRPETRAAIERAPRYQGEPPFRRVIWYSSRGE